MKKKLSVLAALALVTTIGGVYATWVYSKDNISSGYGVSNLAIAGVDYVGDAGSVSVVGTHTEIKIDDPTNGSAYITEMTYDDTGYFTVTFTPSISAKEDIKDGMDIEWYVGLSDGADPLAIEDFVYTFGGGEDQQIFTSIDSTKVLVEQEDMTVSGGAYTFTITMKDVVDKLVLADIKLDSYDKYTAYLNALKLGFIHVHAEVVSGT